MYTFLDIINVDRTFHYENHFVKKIDYNYKIQEEESFMNVFWEKSFLTIK